MLDEERRHASTAGVAGLGLSGEAWYSQQAMRAVGGQGLSHGHLFLGQSESAGCTTTVCHKVQVHCDTTTRVVMRGEEMGQGPSVAFVVLLHGVHYPPFPLFIRQPYIATATVCHNPAGSKRILSFCHKAMPHVLSDRLAEHLSYLMHTQSTPLLCPALAWGRDASFFTCR